MHWFKLPTNGSTTQSTFAVLRGSPLASAAARDVVIASFGQSCCNPVGQECVYRLQLTQPFLSVLKKRHCCLSAQGDSYCHESKRNPAPSGVFRYCWTLLIRDSAASAKNPERLLNSGCVATHRSIRSINDFGRVTLIFSDPPSSRETSISTTAQV